MVILLIKTIILLGIIILITPLIFFVLLGYLGKYFAISINKDSWLAKIENSWIKNITKKFLAKS